MCRRKSTEMNVIFFGISVVYVSRPLFGLLADYKLSGKFSFAQLILWALYTYHLVASTVPVL